VGRVLIPVKLDTYVKGRRGTGSLWGEGQGGSDRWKGDELGGGEEV